MSTKKVKHIPEYKYSTQWQDQNWMLYADSN